MNRKEYRRLFDISYEHVDNIFKETDDRFVIDQLIMYFGFSEPNDYFVLPEMGKLTLALGNFDEAFRVGGLSEFLENCGYCVPDMPRFLRVLDIEPIANFFENILATSVPRLWGQSFFVHEAEVTDFSRAHQWFREQSNRMKDDGQLVIGKLRTYLEQNVILFRNYQIPE